MKPKIFSLHIGVSQVDESHYQNKLAVLSCCETDAKLMYRLADYLNYDKKMLLLSEQATVLKVKEKITEYSKDLSEGDLCIITYSGHGARIPDLNWDEAIESPADETWCLYDRQMIDDEFPHLWKKFKKGVNVLVLVDACHSGTSIKGFGQEEQSKELKQSKSIFLAHEALYRKILGKKNVAEADVQCGVLSLAACQDEEEALSGDPVSYFTGILLKILCKQHNQLTNYQVLFRIVQETSIREKNIRPHYLSYGKSTTFFDENKPFLQKDATYPETIETFYLDWYIDNLEPKGMKIYALLIGINNYPISPLSGCVGDVEKMGDYLDSLASDSLIIKKKYLTNKNATKSAIIENIQDFLGRATDQDVALLYYSGHGAYEQANGRFPEQHNGYLECLVSYFESGQQSGFLLADKEIRYVLGKLPNNPHLVTVFDCCHSGDAVREHNNKNQLKRIVQPFSGRSYNEFVFSKEITEASLAAKSTIVNFPFKNHVHLAACSTSQSSWEDDQGGVFTRYLLTLLKATNNSVSYQDIARWAEISLKQITKKTQSPVYSIQGVGLVKAASSWLNLHDSLALREDTATLVYNKKKGWLLTRGELMGIQSGAALTIDPTGKKIEATVDKVDLTTASIINEKTLDLDIEKSLYAVVVDTIYKDLFIFVNNIDGLSTITDNVRGIVGKTKHVILTEDPGAADFFVTIFNGLIYISRKMDNFRPLAEQIDLLSQASDLTNILQNQLRQVVRWNHYDSLVNPGQNFKNPPIKVEIQIGDAAWVDITNGEFTLHPLAERMLIGQNAQGSWLQLYKLKVTNVSNEKLFVGVLQLDSAFGITSEFWAEQVIELAPNQSKYFYDDAESPEGSEGYINLDYYQEVYNWSRESLQFKFIVNNFENFTNQLAEYLQPSLAKPIILDAFTFRGGGSPKSIVLRNQVRKKWTTIKTTLHLSNPEYDKVSGGLEAQWDAYIKDEKIAPFISQLYFNQVLRGLITESDLIPPPDGERGFKEGSINLGNYLDDHLRKRIFETAKLTMPDKPILLAEGDSWFLYPFLVKDIIDYVMEAFPVRSIAAAGDELENYKKEGQLFSEVARHRPKYVLLSGGGNNIIGEEIQHILADNPLPDQSPEAYLNDKFQENMDKLKELYEFFVKELKEKHPSVKQVFLHGYDYIRADHSDRVVKKGSVNKFMIKKGIQQADRKVLIAHLIDTFNELLETLSENDPFVTYLDLRGQIKEGEWKDEIHPNDEGFKTLGQIFIEGVEARENGVV